MDKSNKHVSQENDQVVFDFARPDGRVIPCSGVCEMLCVFWYHLYNFKNAKNTHGGVLILD